VNTQEDWPSGLFLGNICLSPQIFGNITDATLSHGILIVMYGSGLVRLYSFQAITEQVEKTAICHIVISMRFGLKYDFFFNVMLLE
jgi:hypothetical protein